jgi:hypothetical protein
MSVNVAVIFMRDYHEVDVGQVRSCCEHRSLMFLICFDSFVYLTP